VAEGARLESVYTSKGYRGFESLTLRTYKKCTQMLTNRKHLCFSVLIYIICILFLQKHLIFVKMKLADAEKIIQNIISGIINHKPKDNLTAIRNIFCASFATNTKFTKGFKYQQIIKEKQLLAQPTLRNSQGQSLWRAGQLFQ
jgi:hypothetical protein